MVVIPSNSYDSDHCSSPASSSEWTQRSSFSCSHRVVIPHSDYATSPLHDVFFHKKSQIVCRNSAPTLLRISANSAFIPVSRVQGLEDSSSEFSDESNPTDSSLFFKKRKRECVGKYKRKVLLGLLCQKNLYSLTHSSIQWPEMNIVYFCPDWTIIDQKDSHALKKSVNFSQGSYTQSTLTLFETQWVVRQSRCNGVRTCEKCNTSLPKTSRKLTCPSAYCCGSLVPIKCSVTLYYLFPVDEVRDKRRLIVCISDDDHLGHSHKQA